MPWVDEIDAAPAVSPTGGKWLDDDDPVTEPTPATAGTVEGIGNSFRRGLLAGQRAIEVTQFQPEAPTMRQGRRAFTGAMEDPRYTFGLLGENPDKMEQLLGPAARLNAMTGSARESNIATAGNIADLTTRMEGIPQSAAMQEWAQADNSNWWKVLGNNFLEIAANIFAESVPQASLGMAAGIAGGVTGGPAGAAVGAGTGSFMVEASNAFLEGAARAGVNLKDPEQVRAFFADESKVKEARAFAMERGFSVALFDAFTAGIAGKFLKPAMGKGLGRVAAASAGEAGMQMTGGALGETAAQVVSGQELSAKDIAAEAIGELVTAPTEVASNLREEFQNRGAVKGGRFIDEAPAPAAALPKEPKEEPVSVDALADLQAAMRGNQLKTVPSPLIPRQAPERAGPVPAAPVAAQPTEEMRAALEFQRKTDEAVRAAVENPDKNYAGMERTELELLDAMGDAQAKVALRRMADQESFQPVINQDGLDRRALTKSARQTFALSKNESLADSTFILEDGTPINSDRPEWGGSTHAGVARFGYGNADNPFVPLKFMSDSGAVRVYFTDRGEVPRLYLEASAPLSLQQHITLGRLFGELKKQFASFDVSAEVSTLPPGPEWKKIPSGGEQYNWREKKVIRSAEFSSGQVTEVHRFFAVPASQPVDFVAAQPTGDAQVKAERKRRAKESEAEFLQSLKPPEPVAREAYAGTMEEEAPDSLLSVVNSTQRVAAPPLQSSIDAMRGGKSPREVVTEWGGGRGEHDALVDILEQINVARESKSLAQLGQLRKAYLKAFREGTRPNVDQALGDLVSAREQGFAPAGGVPEDAGTLYARLFEDAGGTRSAEPSAQELGLYFMDTITRDTGRGRKLDREMPVELNALSVGDTLRVKGVELTVSAIDPDNDAVTFRASDPKEFGQTQTLTPEQAPVVYPDFGSYRKVKREMGNERFSFEPLLPEIWNGLIEAVRLDYRGGKSLKDSIQGGLAWLRSQKGWHDEKSIEQQLFTAFSADDSARLVYESDSSGWGSRYLYGVVDGRPWMVRIADHENSRQTKGGDWRRGERLLQEASGQEFHDTVEIITSRQDEVTWDYAVAKIREAVALDAEEYETPADVGEMDTVFIRMNSDEWAKLETIASESGALRTTSDSPKSAADQIQTKSRMVTGTESKAESSESVNSTSDVPPSSRASIAESVSAPSDVAAVESEARRFAQEFPQGPRVVVHRTQAELPARLREGAGDRTVRGVVSSESGAPTVHLVAENIEDAAQARAVLAHEILGHEGMRAVLGDEFGPFMEGVYRDYMTSVDGRKNGLATRLAELYGADTRTAEGRQLVGEEIVARIAEGEIQAPGIWRRVVQAVQRWFRRLTGGNITEDDIRAQLLKAREVMRGKGASEARFSLADEPKGDSLRAQLKALEKEMDVYVDRKEAIPQDLLDRYKDLADTLGEEMRTGREKRGEFTGRVTSVVDSGLEPRPKPAKDTPKPKTRPSGYVPQWKGEERLPGGRLRDLFTGLTNWRQRTGNWLDRREARADITVGRDAGDNRANLAANMAAMNVRLTLNRALNTVPGEVRRKHAAREAALTFVIEADGNGQMLDEFYDRIASSEHAESKAGRQALAAIEYASTHWDAMASAAEQYKRLTTAQREMELNEGINSGEWEGGYIYHRWERDPGEAGADATKPSPSGTPFRKPRSVPNYAEGIAQGRVPLTLNSIELLAERVASGQRRLNELRWVHGLRSMLDPVSDLPVVTDVIRKPVKPVQTQQPRRADPDSTEQAFEEGYKPQYITTAPAGYQVWRLGDLEVAVQEGFVGLLGKLTSQSFFKGEKLKKVFGFVKSSLLMFDTFHLGRMAAWAGVITGNPFSYQRGQTLLDFTESDIREMAKRGEIPESWADGLVENKRRLNLALETGFNVGNVLDNAWGDALHNLPVVGTFNKWLFGQYQRGAMAQAWLIEFERMRKMMPKATELQVARRVSKDVNARFGNLNRQGIFKSRTAQDLVRFVFLAPQWNESLIRSELGAIAQTLKAPIESYQQRRLVAGTLMRATGVMALGTFLVNQVLNYAFRGKPTWENDEEGWDKKLSAWIPDVVSGGPGFFLNPLALPAEYTHLIEGNLHRSGGELMEAIRRVAVSRLHAAARPVEIFLTRKDALGRKLRDGEVLPAMAKSMTPVPIGAVAPATAAKQLFTGEPSEKYPGQYQRQMLSTFGMKVDQAPNAEQRIRTLARDFNKAKGIVPNAEYYAGDFSELDKALRLGNMANAREAMDELLQKKTARQIYEHYVRSVRAPFTGQQGREKEFWRGLTPEQRERYDEARESRKARAVKAAELLKERLKVAR